MGTHYEPGRYNYEPGRYSRVRSEHPEPSAVREREQDARDAYGEFPGQIGNYDDAERRFGNSNSRSPGVPERRAPSRDRWKQSESQTPEAPSKQTAERNDASHGFRGRGPRGYTRSDERIREEVCELLTDEDIDVSDVEVRVSNGEVTLTGTVRDRRTKREVESVVDGVSGVNDVSNQLRLKGVAEGSSRDALSALGEERTTDDADTRMP